MKQNRVTGLFVSLLFLTGCFQLKKQKVETIKIVNVLDKVFYDDCHIKNSVHVPFVDIEKYAQKWPRTTKIVVYCSNYSCTASGYAAKLLKKMGFEYVKAYEAGMAGWYQAQLPYEGPAKESYLTLENKPRELGSGDEDLVIMTQELKELMEKELNNN